MGKDVRYKEYLLVEIIYRIAVVMLLMRLVIINVLIPGMCLRNFLPLDSFTGTVIYSETNKYIPVLVKNTCNKISYKSYDYKVAQINRHGVIKTNRKGQALILVSYENKKIYYLIICS